MAVPPERSGGQNSAYRSGCHISFIFSKLLTRPRLSVLISPVNLRVEARGAEVGDTSRLLAMRKLEDLPLVEALERTAPNAVERFILGFRIDRTLDTKTCAA